MSWVTIFSAPKPFTEPRIARIQMNAVSSWSKLEGADVMLMGEEAGIAEAARRVGARHIASVECNASGTPLISSMIQMARDNSDSELLCIINADMIIMQDLMQAATTVQGKESEFVILGRRWDVDIAEELGFQEGWEDRLRRRVREGGQLHRPAGSDFFVFPRACYQDVPDFAVGRAGWDNWMIYKARRAGWPVIDCTPSVVIVHQNHDYGHLPGGAPHYSMPESDENIRLAGGEVPVRYTVLDATHCLRGGQLARPALSYPRLLRGVELFLRRIFFFLPPRMIEEVARPKRWKKRFLRLIRRNGGVPEGPG